MPTSSINFSRPANPAARGLAVLALAFLVALVLQYQARATDYLVSSAPEIQVAASQARPGDTLTMRDGLWPDADILFAGAGSDTSPITLRAQTPGQVILSGASRLRISGAYLVVDGLKFINGYLVAGDVIAFRNTSSSPAKNCRVTNCAIIDYNPDIPDGFTNIWVSLYGVSNRVDNCYLKGKDDFGSTMVVWVESPQRPNYHSIDHNYFAFRTPLGVNGGETIRVGNSDVSTNNSRTIVQNNYFEQCNGDAEIISSKSCENIFRHNTFVDCEGALSLRHGSRSVVEGNYFFGHGKPLTGGVRITAEDHTVFNNYFDGLAGTQARAALSIMQGLVNSPLNGYFQVKRATVAFNTFVNCTNSFIVGLAGTLSGSTLTTTLPPLDCTIANNLVLSSSGPLIDQRIDPVNLTWLGNIFYGAALGIPSNGGLTETNPKLGLGADGLWRPGSGSPALGAAQGSYDFVTEDIEGQSRSGAKDVGCDQLSTAPVTQPPMTAFDVGPVWMHPGSTILTWANPTNITYGKALGLAQLDATANVPGTFDYSPPFGTLLNASLGQTLSVVFTPRDPSTYSAATQSVTIDVAQAAPVIVWPKPTNIVYGTALSDTQLSALANVQGTFSYNPPVGTLVDAGNGQALSATFTPADTANYSTVTKLVSIDVSRATPIISWHNPAPIDNGTVLSAAQLNATANVPGTFIYSPPPGTVLSAGSGQTLSATFLPAAVGNYLSATQTVVINVTSGGKLLPNISWANPGDISFGTPLLGAQLNAAADVPGTFLYTPPAGTVLNLGNNQVLSVTFIPDDTTKYTSVSRVARINVTAALNNALIHVAYLIPTNRVAQNSGVSNLKNAVLLYQSWFRHQMERNGFGPKTFAVETEGDGVTPKIYTLALAQSDSYLRADLRGGRIIEAARATGVLSGAPGQIWWLVPETHLENADGSIQGGAHLSHTYGGAGNDPGWAISGSDSLALWQSSFLTNDAPYDSLIMPQIGPYPLQQDISFPWFEGRTLSSVSSSSFGAGLRQIGEALGLDHDFRNDENFSGNLMGYGFSGIRGATFPKLYPYNDTRLSYGSALALNVSPFFNVGTPVTDSIKPNVTISTSGSSVPLNGVLHINFSASDAGGLSLALLSWKKDADTVLVDEMSLFGMDLNQTFATAYYDPGQTNVYTISVFDLQGNEQSVSTTLVPLAGLNQASQPFITVTPATVGLGEDVVLDASATFDAHQNGSSLEVEWDLNGDGVFDTLPSTSLLFTNQYLSLGTRLVRARISDAAGAESLSTPLAVNVTLCPAILEFAAKTHGPGASTGTNRVTTGDRCNWTAASLNDWITINATTNFVGSAKVSYTLAENPMLAPRTGTVVIADQAFTIFQNGFNCKYTLSPTNRFHGSSPTTNSARLTTHPQCVWTVINTNTDWITVPITNGSGSNLISYSLTSNKTSHHSRTGMLAIADQIYTIIQWGTACEYVLSPVTWLHGAGMETGLVSVASNGGCPWTVDKTNDWITLNDNTNGIGIGSVGYTVSPNLGRNARSGILNIAGQSFLINQAACAFTLLPTERLHGSGLESGLVTVTGSTNCSWNIFNPNPWITVGSAIVTPSPILAIDSKALGFLTLGWTPSTAVFVLQRTASLKEPVAWTTTTNVPTLNQGRLAVTLPAPNGSQFYRLALASSGGENLGSGTVTYSVEPNPFGKDRTGVLTIAGQPFTITQQGIPCAYELSDTQWDHGEGYEAGEVDVTAAAPDCPWSVRNTNAWISLISSPNQSGSGSVIYTVDANTGPARNGTLMIAGFPFLVNQDRGARLVALGDLVVGSGQANCIPLSLETHGNENALSFSLCYDPTLLTFASAQLSDGASSETLVVNTSQSAAGHVGLTVASPPGWGMSAGTQTLVQVCFRGVMVTGNVTTAVTICDQPVPRRLTDVLGQPLSATYSNATVTLIGLCTLGESVDALTLGWSTDVSVPWFCQTNVTHSGGDAAQSGAVADGGSSALQTTVTGPGTISFWWKASSETNNDTLRFYISGVEQARISGEADWQQQSFNVPSQQNQVLQWKYSKNSNLISAGQDCGWLDQVQFVPAPLAITTQPTGKSVDAGSVATLSVAAAGTPPLSYQWQFNGTSMLDGVSVSGSRTPTLTLSNLQPAQSGNYSVVVSDAMGVLASSNALLTVLALVPLAEALDANLLWTTTASFSWVGQGVVTHDGVAAARSAPIPDSGTTSLQTTINGPGVLSFWWKVSSEPSNDKLRFYLAGTSQASISGEVDWTQQTYNIPSGSQTLEWRYTKNSSIAGGQDRAWVDQVQFTPVALSITTQPVSTKIDGGGIATFTVVASGTPPLAYQWRFNGTNLVDGGSVRGAATTSLTLSNVQPAQAGGYAVIVSSTAETVASSSAFLVVTPVSPLPQALDATNLIWTTTASFPWVGQSIVTHDGVSAARSGAISDSGTTSLQTTVNGPGVLGFWWKVSSEPSNDRLRFYLAGSSQASISGEVDWTWQTYAIPSGSQNLEWRYTKNSSISAGQDRGWVDQVIYIPNSVPTAPLIVIQPVGFSVVAPASVKFNVAAIGSSPLSYQWQFNGTNLANGGNVSGAASTNLTLSSVGAAQGGFYSVIVTNVDGSVTSSNALLSVVTAPVITNQPASQNVAGGSTVTFSVGAVGLATLQYQWQFNGVNLVTAGNVSGANTATLKLSGVQAGQSGAYSVLVSNSAGNAASSNAFLAVISPPVVLSQPLDQTVGVGADATFNVSVVGTTPLSYHWRINGTNLLDGSNVAGATTSTLLLSHAQPPQAGRYSVVISNALGGTVSSNALLTVISPPVITSQPFARTVAEGTTVTFIAAASGSGPLSYTWRFNGSNLVNGGSISGAATPSLTLAGVHPTHAGNYSVLVSNLAGLTLSSNALLGVMAGMTLADAVNAPYLTWDTGVSAPWVAQTNMTHDGLGAAQSGAVTNSQNTWLQITVEGPGTIRFWWRVSSETNRDQLSFLASEVALAAISGEVDWQEQAFNLQAGTQLLQWVYSKDGNASTGQDRGWLDQVEFTPTIGPVVPVLLSQPLAQSIAPGGAVAFKVAAAGTAPLSYQWHFNGAELIDGDSIMGAASATLSIANVQRSQQGTYNVVVRNDYGLANSSKAFLTVVSPIPLAEALDTTNRVWLSGGYSPWLGETTVNHDWVDAAQSGPLPPNQTNWIETAVPGPSAITFWWKVSSETNHDRLRFSINGIEQANISGEVNWQWRTFDLTNANQVVHWAYTKDTTGTAGLDRGWVDQVQFGPLAPTITREPVAQTADSGAMVSFNVATSGTQPINYQWHFNGNNLSGSPDVVGTSLSKVILSNVQPAQSGFYNVIAMNGGGRVLSTNVFLSVLFGQPFAQALDPATNVSHSGWTTGGDLPWLTESLVTHDGISAAQSGAIGDTQRSSLQTTVTGPGKVSFYWKVSSQTNSPGTLVSGDRLRFFIGGVEQAHISGEVNWQLQLFDVTNGIQTLEWRYQKDGALAGGQDRAWVDQVQYAQVLPPILTSQPASLTVDPGSSVGFNVTAVGSPPFAYQWRHNGLLLVDGAGVIGATTPALRLSSVGPDQAGTYSVVVSNAAAIVTSFPAVLGLTPTIPLAIALDTPNWTWTTAGSPPWLGQTTVSEDGVGAARNGIIGDSASSSMQTTLTGPGTVTFWWKVSSETNRDFLQFSIGSSLAGQISGEVDWYQISFAVPSGTQVLKWTYTKNSSLAMGQDLGWVDQVQFTGVPPTITTQPVSQTVDEGTTVNFNAGVSGTPPLNYQWQLNGSNVSGATNATLALPMVQLAQSGNYSVIVNNAVGSVTSLPASLVVTPILPLADSLNPALIWSTSGSAPWVGQSVVSRDGAAARSGLIGDKGTSSMQTTVNGPGAVTFWWKVSSETNNDTLIFFAGSSGSTEQARISGEVDWQPRTFNLPSGTQILKWTYSKNSSLSNGQDRAWVDLVQFGPTAPVITNQPASQTVDMGTTVTFNVGASGGALSYQWQLNGGNLANGAGISGATTPTLILANVQPSQAGTYSVIVSNTATTIISSPALLAVTSLLPLAQALDTPTWTWTTNGTSGWVGQTAVSYDGANAARSGVLGNSAFNSMQTILSGPGTLRFWWKVSSETNNDTLRFFIGGVEQARISGEVDWQSKTFSILSGSQILQWSYAKNGSVSSGQDRAWVDQVQFIPTNPPPGPVITGQPLSQTVTQGALVTLTVAATSSNSLNYQWLFNGANLANSTNLSGANAAILLLSNALPSQAGPYSVRVSDLDGVVTSSIAILTVAGTGPLTFADAVNAPTLVFAQTGSPTWFPETSVTHDGVAAAQSGAIPAGAFTKFETHVTGPTNMSFWWKVSSVTNSDVLSFTLGSTVLAQISGEVDWQQVSFSVPSGTTLLKWRYSKSSTGTGDAAWVDQILFPGSAFVPIVVTTPIVVNVTLSTNNVVLTWPANPGKSYQVFYKDTLLDTAWKALGTAVVVNNSIARIEDVANGQSQRFYQIMEY